jgi:hypothetical protein
MRHIRSQITVDTALLLSDHGVKDSDTALICGVAVKTVRRWRRLYQRQGLPRGQASSSAACPRCEDGALAGPSYAELLGWYLGDGHITWSGRKNPVLSVFNDERYTVLTEQVRSLIADVKPGSRPHVRQREGCVAIRCGWKHWPCLFPQHGPGQKHTRPIVLADWQREIVEQHPGRFLRGLFHPDGCRVTNWTVRTVAGRPKRYEYPRYFFTNASADIRGLCCWALDLVEVPWRQSAHRTISVSRRTDVARLDALIGLKT